MPVLGEAGVGEAAFQAERCSSPLQTAPLPQEVSCAPTSRAKASESTPTAHIRKLRPREGRDCP